MKKYPLLFCVCLLCPLIFAGSRVSAAMDPDLKAAIRNLFSGLSDAVASEEIAVLPDGIDVVSIPGCKGLRLDPRFVRVQPHVWSESCGLMDEFTKVSMIDKNVVAAINGTFYSTQGALGQIIVDGKIPHEIRQFSSRISRCFFGIFSDGNNKKWVLGETGISSSNLLKDGFTGKSRINRPITTNDKLEGLLGGGGWIIRESRDVHMEAYNRQNFRFRKVDQDSRHTVLAMDELNRLYILVFESGANLSKISESLRGKREFSRITDAVFLDGGSSSTIVVMGKYLVAPLYLIDKARLSALFVFKLPPISHK